MSYGNLIPLGEQITLGDLLEAVEQTHELLGPPAPEGVSRADLERLVTITHNANTAQGRSMGYGATLIWGVAIGILAERNRINPAPGGRKAV